MNYNQLQYQGEKGLLYTEDERQMGMFLHLSALANLIIPFAGYVIPIVIWQTQKEKSPGIEAHGKEAVNWMISSFIYSVLTILMMVVGIIALVAELPILGIILIGVSFLLLIAFSLANIIFSVIAGVKAGNGEHWEYPINIRFIK